MYVIQKTSFTLDNEGNTIESITFDSTYYEEYEIARDCCHQWALDDCPSLNDGYHCSLDATSEYDAIITDLVGTPKHQYTILELIRKMPPEGGTL